MVWFDHRPPPVQAHRPKAFAKKSRSTTSWPILAWSFSTSASRLASAASALPENTDAIPSIACLREVESPPGRDHRLMNPVPGRQLRQRQLPLQRFKGHLRLEIRRITLPRVRQRYRPLIRSIPAYLPVRNPGAHLRRHAWYDKSYLHEELGEGKPQARICKGGAKWPTTRSRPPHNFMHGKERKAPAAVSCI